MRQVVFIAALMISSAVLADDEPAAPQANADIKAANEQLLSQTPEAAGVFVVQDNGTIRHLQSGTICPAKFPNVMLWHLEVFSGAEKGSDVGCDYGRNDSSGNAVSKLTVFATKAPVPMTLDQAFANYRAQFVQVNPSASSIGKALNIKDEDKGTSAALPEWRSEEWLTHHDDQDITDDLIVTVRNGWLLEVRVTYLGAPNKIAVGRNEGPHDVVNSLGDRLLGSLAYVQVSPTIGSQPAP